MENTLTEQDLNDLQYFWQEKEDLERLSTFERLIYSNRCKDTFTTHKYGIWFVEILRSSLRASSSLLGTFVLRI